MNAGFDHDPQDIREALHATHLFSDVLSAAQLDALALECVPRTFSPATVLMHQGGSAETMFCIVEGSVTITYADVSNRAKVIRQLGAGSVVGEIELLTGEPRIATVTAATRVRVLEIPKRALEAAFARSPDLIESFAAILAIRQEMLQQLIPERRAASKSGLAGQIRKVFSRR